MIVILMIILLCPRIELNKETIEVGKSFELNIKSYNTFKDLSDKVTIKNNQIDINKIGKYNIELEIKHLLFNINKTFNIDVIDTEPPIINLTGESNVTVCPNKEYIEEGYTATDNYDKDITNKVNIEKNNNSIIYNVYDSSNNFYKKERIITYKDEENPSISLKGNQVTSIYLGEKYYDQGYTANDNCDGDITSNVIVNSNVDTTKLGTYKVSYEVTDSSNNKVTTERTVVVRKKTNYYGNGKIYLTFDDGSSYLTNQILDILKEENVKATFFVVSVNDTTKRAYNEGHAIALHSNTHNYGYIYSSVDNYFNDLNTLSYKVYNLIGINPKIIRFPGGSSNVISRNYSYGIMTRLTAEVLNRGYIYFDWNVDSNDAGSDIYNSNNIYYNVVNNLSHSKTNIVLMHDSAGHNATVNALRNIIQYGKTYGYTFDVITENTPVVAHPVYN